MSHLGLSDCFGTSSAAVQKLFTRSSQGFMERDMGRFIAVQVPMESSLYNKTIDMIARGECGTAKTAPDPLLDWVYADRKPEDTCICKPLPEDPDSHRLAWFRFLAQFMVDFGCKRRGTYALLDKKTKQVVAGAVTAPPFTVHNAVFTCHQADLRRAGMPMAVEVLTHPRMSVLGSWQHHTQEKLGLKNAFLEVMMFATAPEFQGQGCGSALLRLLGDIADADGATSLLETAGEKNTTFYSKKGGFEEYDRQTITTFKHNGGGVGMLRHPLKK